jgi:hypothetical protein
MKKMKTKKRFSVWDHAWPSSHRSKVGSAAQGSALSETLRGKATVKCYWEIIADNLSKASWSWGCVATVDFNGRTIWIVDAYRDDGNVLLRGRTKN